MQLTAHFDEALVYAHQLHARQRRKGSDTPYIAHLLAVAALVIEAGSSEDEATATLLHDAVEDQGGQSTRAEIAQRFGELAALVDGCADADQIPKPSWCERKEAFIASLAGVMPSVRLVASADTLHNARAALADYRRLSEALWRYRATVDAPTIVEPSSLVAALGRVVTELERLATKRETA